MKHLQKPFPDEHNFFLYVSNYTRSSLPMQNIHIVHLSRLEKKLCRPGNKMRVKTVYVMITRYDCLLKETLVKHHDDELGQKARKTGKFIFILYPTE